MPTTPRRHEPPRDDRRERRFRKEDRSRSGLPWRGVVMIERFDPILARWVEGPTTIRHLPVTFDGESVVFRESNGDEWQFGIDDLMEAIGLHNWP